jgi:DNA polymerase-1
VPNKDVDEKIAASVISTLPDTSLANLNKFLDVLLEHRRIEKLRTTYIKGVKKAIENNGENKIFVQYSFDGTDTGRLSNAGMSFKKKKKGVSFHTLPRDEEFNIRSYVTAPKNYKFLTADYSGMELRVLAHIAREDNMIRAFKDGKDLHSYSASMTYSKAIEKVTSTERQDSKEVSFLTIYGGSEYTLAHKKGISKVKAKKIIDSWMGVFPGVPRYMKFIREKLEETGYCYSIFGRKRHLPNIWAESFKQQNRAFRQGLNFTVQSPASDILLCALIGIDLELKARGLDAMIVATVHDSIELICHESCLDEVIGIIYHQMVNYPYLKSRFDFELCVPLEVELLVGSSFGEGEEVKNLDQYLS